MRSWLKLVIGLTLVGAAVAALIYLNRRKTTAPATGSATSPALASNLWAVSDALQQTHLTALTAQVNERPSRTEIADMIQQAIAQLPTSTPTNPSTPGTDTDTDFVALFNEQMS